MYVLVGMFSNVFIVVSREIVFCNVDPFLVSGLDGGSCEDLLADSQAFAKSRKFSSRTTIIF